MAAVEEGRVIFDNIRKFVFYLFSCNVAEVLVLLCAALAGLPMPLLPLQILWLNMVTDTFPALALALEPGDANVMERAPRNPRETLLSGGFLMKVAFYGSLITAATLTAFALELDGSVRRAQTVAFMTLAFAQLFHLANARSDEPLAGRTHVSNPYAVGRVAALDCAAADRDDVTPLARVLGVETLERQGLRRRAVICGDPGSSWSGDEIPTGAPALIAGALDFDRAVLSIAFASALTDSHVQVAIATILSWERQCSGGDRTCR